MSDATKRTCGCDWSLWETCDECNPDDEAAEIERLRTRLAESEAEVGRLVRSCDGWQEDARLYARNAADWEAKCHAAEAERDDLLGALREMVDDLGYPDGPDEPEPVVLSRARAAIAKVGGPARPEVERGKCGECGTGREGTNG